MKRKCDSLKEVWVQVFKMKHIILWRYTSMICLEKEINPYRKKKHCRIYSPESVIIGDLAHIKSGLSAEHGIASFLSGESMGLVD